MIDVTTISPALIFAAGVACGAFVTALYLYSFISRMNREMAVYAATMAVAKDRIYYG